MSNTETCFHCALPNPVGTRYLVEIDGEHRAVCCPGCKAVAEFIRDTGMGNYYALRDAPAPGVARPTDESSEWQLFNDDEMQHAFTVADGDLANASIYVGGMYCSACSWLIDTSLTRLPGVRNVDVNPLTHRLKVTWSRDAAGLGDILAALAQLGFKPQALAPDDRSRPEIAEQRGALKRLLVASLGMMQVMMFAVGLYVGDFKGIDADMQYFLRLVSLLVATVVVFYAGRPFFVGAWRGVRNRSPGMDLPVSIAIGAAYVASVYATFTRGPAVWFDSVAMFVFFLTLGRYLEMRARHRSADRSIALSQLVPNTAIRLLDDAHQTVAVSQLQRGDTVLVRSGEAVPADGIVTSGSSSLDESLLTGESDPRARAVGDTISAGSVNIDSQLEMRVLATGADTALGAISRLSERARYARPTFVTLADRIASIVVVALLLVATCVAVFWGFRDPSRAFEITLSVLVVTCPCALALATPAAFAAAANRLAALQLLLTNGNAIEALSRTSQIVFDKTGTLTRGQPSITHTTVYDDSHSVDDCLAIAAALEQSSTHPIAAAFSGAGELPRVDAAEYRVASGVSGTISGRHYRIGKADFASNDVTGAVGNAVYLGYDGHLVARFDIADQLRPDAASTVDALRALGLKISIASGDNAAAVRQLAETLRIESAQSGCSAADKLQLIEQLQRRGECVVMVGDGINDAPVLAGADASIAPGRAALLAQTSADMIMLGESLSPVLTAVRLARATMRTVRQNLAWAIGYNALALPLAAAGMIPPWLAAIGMSMSSLIVVLNALRLSRFQ